MAMVTWSMWMPCFAYTCCLSALTNGMPRATLAMYWSYRSLGAWASSWSVAMRRSANSKALPTTARLVLTQWSSLSVMTPVTCSRHRFCIR
jgi:hypothetical protein